ncbi:MAG TPA: GNAT family N-acetyltransferase [Candidatus Dormibacteraeota bacterium]
MPELPAHTAEIEVGAPPDQVWRAITDPEITRRYVFHCDIEGEWEPGAAWRYHRGDETLIGGTVVEARPPHLLRLTARDYWYPGGDAEPPYRITWQVEPVAAGGCLVRVTFDGFEAETPGYRNNANPRPILEGLRNQVDPDAAAALRRLDDVGEVTVRSLVPELLDDFLDFFDHRAFADNPSWSGCYCFEHRFAGDERAAAARTGVENRSDMAHAITARRAHGLLAYVDGRAVGWCSASPKAEMVQFGRRDWMPAESDRVGIIGCLVIAPQHRRHGVARKLVAAAGDHLAGLGCTVAEAYPVKELNGDAHGFFGPLEIYRDLGYETYRDLPQRLVVRKQLATGR